jgi:Fur family ferric uptake transcriptional regulator
MKTISIYMDTYTEQLQKNGLKATPKRVAIIDYFVCQNRALTPEEVWIPLKKRFGQLGLPSVYRNLESLADCCVLTRIHRFDNKRYYALCHTHCCGHHHHIVCTACGRVGEFLNCHLKTIKEVDGFKVTSHFVQLEGLCAQCQKEN